MFLNVTKLRGDAQLAKEMVVKSGEKNGEEPPLPVRVLSDGDTPLHSAASNGEVSEVKALLAKGAEVDAKTKYGSTPLHLAAWKGHLDVVKELLAKGAEVNAKNKYGETPLYKAAENGHLDVVKELLAKGAEVNAKNKYGETPLDLAIDNGHWDVVKELLAKGAEVNAKNKYGETPLYKAAENGHLDVVKELLAKGAEVNAKNKYGETPLYKAAENGHLDVVKVLLSNGAEVTSFTHWNGGEHVVKQVIKLVIKLAQHSSKPEESSETLIILTDLLQAGCLPEVAQWAVNHSYAIDAFPAEASTARSCVLQYMSPEARKRLALGSKWSYVYPVAGVAIAAVSAYMVEPLILHHFGSVDAPNHKETHKFYHGAHLLVAKAAISGYWPKMAFRFFEVITIIGFFMGFAMVELWWVWWLPFVGLLFLLPGIKLHGTKELMRTPVKWLSPCRMSRLIWSFFLFIFHGSWSWRTLMIIHKRWM